VEQQHLTRVVIGCAFSVHRTLGPGFLESVYQNALAHELRKASLDVRCGERIRVQYDGLLVGDFIADMLIQNSVLVENKAVQELSKAHEVQLVNYLVATEVDIGLLLNFGAPRLQVKRKSRRYRSTRRTEQSGQDEHD
jgi:GxxExxY protein